VDKNVQLIPVRKHTFNIQMSKVQTKQWTYLGQFPIRAILFR